MKIMELREYILVTYWNWIRWAGVSTSVPDGAGWGGFSLCDPAVTPARSQLFAVSPRPVWHGALAGLSGRAGILISPLIA